jgi:hypothetical protein
VCVFFGSLIVELYWHGVEACCVRLQVLAGQPLQLMLKDLSSGGLMMKFEVWHKRMLQHRANSSANDEPDGNSISDTATAAEILIKKARAIVKVT